MIDLYIEPLADRVLVKPDPIEEISKGGIVLNTDKKIERAQVHTGTLVAYGKYAWDEYPEKLAEVGDRIMYVKYGGAEVQDPVTEEVYIVLNDRDITFKIKEHA